MGVSHAMDSRRRTRHPTENSRHSTSPTNAVTEVVRLTSDSDWSTLRQKQQRSVDMPSATGILIRSKHPNGTSCGELGEACFIRGWIHSGRQAWRTFTSGPTAFTLKAKMGASAVAADSTSVCVTGPTPVRMTLSRTSSCGTSPTTFTVPVRDTASARHVKTMIPSSECPSQGSCNRVLQTTVKHLPVYLLTCPNDHHTCDHLPVSPLVMASSGPTGEPCQLLSHLMFWIS